MRWEFHEGHKDPLCEQCVEYSSDKKRSTDWMFLLYLSETIEQLAMANSVHWYGHVFWREDGHLL